MTSHVSPLQPPRRDRRAGTGKTDDFGIGRHMGFALLLGALLIGGLGGWAVTARLGAAVIGPGAVKVDRDLRPVQYLDGGALAEIFLEPGQTIAAGEPLMRFETAQLDTELAVRRGLLLDLEVRAARLRALRDDMDGLLLRPGLAESHADAAEVIRGEMLLFQSERLERAARLKALELRHEQLGHDTRALDARRTALEEEIRLAAETRTRTKELVARGSVPLSRLEDIGRDHARVTGELGEVSARLASNAAQIGEIELEIARLGPQIRHEAHRQLREIEPRIAELTTQVAALSARLDRAVVRAPAAGTVHEVLVNTPGQVVAPGAMLATLVPQDADLVIEFRIAPTDIDQITPGQPARLRFPAFDQRTTPELPGTVRHVAPATTTDPATGASYYTAVAAADPGAELPGGRKLVPGMPVEVFIPTLERTPADYFLQPFRDSFARAMTEG